jgi:putative photosynthetic complex assembly protein 2
MSWSGLGPPVAITIFAWWLSTGLILLLVRLPRSWHARVLLGFGMAASIGVWGIIASSNNQTEAGVYCGFLCALLIWGWHEASFLMGIITGPRPKSCPEGVRGLRRFGFATATLIYHELALFLSLLALWALTRNSANLIGILVFGSLFAMRLSAKFNIFLGVPNLTDEFFPPHLEHLKSYLPKRKMNWLMPISLVAGTLYIAVLWSGRQDYTTAPVDGTRLTVLITLVALGMLEHVFMITPLPDAALWRWAAPAQKGKPENIEEVMPAVPSAKKRSENV